MEDEQTNYQIRNDGVTTQCTVYVYCYTKGYSGLWNIEDKLFSITLDNAKVNNSMMDLLKANLLLKKMLPCEGNLFHVHCGAHVINLAVQYGLRKISGIVSNIRESVKYIKSSQSRREKFEEIAVQMGISLEKQPTLDISTSWNSTYLMLQSACPFKTVLMNWETKTKVSLLHQHWLNG